MEQSDQPQVDPTIHSAISPHFTRAHFGEELTDIHKVEVFADRVRGWQLDPAAALIRSDPHAGFAVMSIVMSYFEMIAEHRDGYRGEGKAKEFFLEGARWVFRSVEVEDQLKERTYKLMWRAVRNGMYHDGVTGQRIALSRSADMTDSVMKVESEDDAGEIIEVRINPEALVLRLQHHFSVYLATLLADEPARARFIARFDWAASRLVL